MATTAAHLRQPSRLAEWLAPIAVAIGLFAVATGALAVVGAVDDDGGGGTAASGAEPEGDDTVALPASGDAAEHSHGPHGESEATYEQLALETQAQVDVVREIARRYPTGADAEAAGWHKATLSLTGIGSHYLKGGVGGFTTIDATFDINEPEILLYDGEGPDAKIAGISYLVSGEDPAGFAGDDDVWHRHNGVCLKDGIVIAEIDGHEGSKITMSEAQCSEAGGLSFPIGNLTMLHVWVGEGYEDGVPTFAHDHPMLY